MLGNVKVILMKVLTRWKAPGEDAAAERRRIAYRRPTARNTRSPYPRCENFAFTELDKQTVLKFGRPYSAGASLPRQEVDIVDHLKKAIVLE